MNITDGTRVHSFDFLLTRDHQLYAHDGGVMYLFSPSTNRNVGIEVVGMTRDEMVRAVSAADTLLFSAETPNRQQRRAEGH